MPREAVDADLIAQLLADASQAVCPNCGATGFWDNRKSKKGVGKGPVFACKNKDECDTGGGYPYGVFKRALPKEAAAEAKAGVAPKQPVSWKQIRTAYAECVSLALQGAAQIGKTGTPIIAENVTVMVNGLMMTRERTSCWPSQGPVAAPAASPAPQKPKASAKPPEPEFEDYSGGEEAEDQLPF